jgi:hypothetical protein
VGDEKYFAFFHSFIKADRYACVFMACFTSLKFIGIIRIHTVRIRHGTVGTVGVL